MNYIELINQFWRLRRSKRITNLQADLYFFLIQESNQRSWENPFQCPNGLVCSSIGITEKSLIDARNVLQQLGLIEFEKGITKQKAPVYYLPKYWNKVSNPVSIPVGNRGGNEGGNPVYINTKPNQKKQNQKDSSGDKSPAPKKKKRVKKKEVETEPYWDQLVKVWFDFNVEKFLLRNPGADPKDGEPSFKGSDPRDLKHIIGQLKARAKRKFDAGYPQFEWTEGRAMTSLREFLDHCFSDPWLSANFLLSNILKQFDNFKNGPKNGQQTGKTARGAGTEASIAAVLQATNPDGN